MGSAPKIINTGVSRKLFATLGGIDLRISEVRITMAVYEYNLNLDPDYLTLSSCQQTYIRLF